MYVTTHLPDGSRDVYRVADVAEARLHAWSVVICGRRELGHIVGREWTVWRHTTTQEHARELVCDLERTCAVERAVVLPTVAEETGPVWTAIGCWAQGRISLLAVVGGDRDLVLPDSEVAQWCAQVSAPNAQRALLAAYQAVDEAQAGAEA